jgi:hypothetical protein
MSGNKINKPNKESCLRWLLFPEEEKVKFKQALWCSLRAEISDFYKSNAV